jgi:methionyl-tRNA formyltransferase
MLISVSGVPAHGIGYFAYARPDDILTARETTGTAAALVVGWYNMIPRRVREAFRLGCFGIHASLLPKYRGGAPLNWAILNQDCTAGVSFFELTEGVDDGLIFAQRSFLIDEDDYIGDLLSKAEAATLDVVSEVMPLLLHGISMGKPQEGEPSFSLQRQPSDGEIDWTKPATEIARLVRAVSRPYPGAFATLGGRRLTIWRASALLDAPRVFGAVGQIIRLPTLRRPAVVTGAGLLMIDDIEGDDDFDIAALAKCHQQRFENASRF